MRKILADSEARLLVVTEEFAELLTQPEPTLTVNGPVFAVSQNLRHGLPRYQIWSGRNAPTLP